MTKEKLAPLKENPVTGYLEPVPIEAPPAPDARPTLKLVINPDESNPLTYTAAVKIGDLVLAVDDHDEETFAELVAQDDELATARIDAANAYNTAIKAKAPTDELKVLAAQFEAIDAQRLSIGREVATQKVKGIREDDGKFYPVGDARPIRTLPARVELLNALAQRATLGRSDKDFLDSL